MRHERSNNFFEGSPLDRAAHLRSDRERVQKILDNPSTQFVPVWRSWNLVTSRTDPAPIFLPHSQSADLLEAASEVILLGLRHGGAWVAVDISGEDEPIARFAVSHGEFANIHRLEGFLDAGDAAILAHARAMTYWHQRHQFCGTCGAPTESGEAGYLRKCTNAECGLSHFPRTDPAIIVLVSSGDHCLLGRQAAWPAGWYSTLAGFVEPGESLREAVRREVHEEVGVAVEQISFHSSQPWPFPASLMLGFTAHARVGPLTASDELEDARWFSRDEVVEMRDEVQQLRLPRRVSIARRLIEDWLDRTG